MLFVCHLNSYIVKWQLLIGDFALIQIKAGFCLNRIEVAYIDINPASHHFFSGRQYVNIANMFNRPATIRKYSAPNKGWHNADHSVQTKR